MTNRQDLHNLLLQREGAWVGRDDINFVGGSDASRRMREVREDIAASGKYRLDERRDEQGRTEYRLVAFTPAEGDGSRYQYRCSGCGSMPGNYANTMASIDPRWRLGNCIYCHKRMIFTKVTDLRVAQ